VGKFNLCYRAPVPDKLPEEFAPTGPKLSRFPIRPAPPIKPRLFPDEARFALRLAVLAGGTEFALWAVVAGEGRRREVLLVAALRLLRPFWAKLGTRLPRPAIAATLLLVPLLALGGAVVSGGRLAQLALVALAVPAVADLCATCIADRVTVERRAAAFAWLDMGQALGAAAGLAVGVAYGRAGLICAILSLLLAFAGVPQLRDRGTPRSSWPAAAYAATLATPLVSRLAVSAFLCGLLAGPGSVLWAGHVSWLPGIPRWAALLVPLAGMAAAARMEPLLPDAVWLPRIAVLVAFLGDALPWGPLQGLALGMMFAAIPAAVARGAGELERPLASSLAWSALIAGAALGAVV
jgi:hypothetical protein